MLESDEGDGGIRSGSTVLGSGLDEELEASGTTTNVLQANSAWRPRQYKVWGIEPRLDFKHKAFGLDSDAVVGFRYHEEDITRRKYVVDGLNQGILGLNDAIDTGYLNERIKHKVEAKSAYFQNTFYAGNWSVTPGLRYEHYKIKQNVWDADEDFYSGDTTEDGVTRLEASGTPVTTSGTRSKGELLPGLGLAWNGIANTTIFTGVHRGFAPARPDRDLVNGALDKTTPELSTNYELGFRSKYFNGINLASTLFYTDFDDIVVRGAGGTFDNAGEAKMAGLELAGRVDFGTIYNTPHNFYVAASYTNLFTAKLKKDINYAGEFEGTAQSGARLAYAPKNMASVSFGYSHPIGINARIGADYVSEQKADLWTRNPTDDGDPTDEFDNSGMLGNIPSYTLINASVNFKPVGSKVTYFVSGTNLGDKEYLASRVDGMAVGRSRQVFGGVKIDF